MSKNYKHIDTKLIHAGEPSPRVEGSVSIPIFQSAMFEYAGESDYHDLKYIRLNNTPNHDAVHAKLAALENAEAAVVTASGMAAISTAGPWSSSCSQNSAICHRCYCARTFAMAEITAGSPGT